MGRWKTPTLDADAFESRLEEAIPKRPDGVVITVWHTFAQGAASLRSTLLTAVNEHEVRLNDDHAQVEESMGDIATLKGQVSNLKSRVSALEAQPADPFPVSG